MCKSKLWAWNYGAVRKALYDYESQKLFLTEALCVLDKTFEYYDKFQLKFGIDEESVEKAIWMLHLDALDTLRDCLLLLQQRRYRIVGKMFRDVTETLDLATLFWWESDSGSKHIKDWYVDKVVPHSEFRNHLKESKKLYQTDIQDPSFAEYSNEMYKGLSKWTHHCYSTLKKSYSVAGENGKMLVYDGHSEVLILQETILEYIWELKDLILYFLGNIKMVGLADWSSLSVSINGIISGIRFI